MTPDPWTREAARLPVAFAQVREDPAVDAALLEECPGGRAVMIASGGDTAAWLVATERTTHLHLVDANPAQLTLTQLKLRLLRECPTHERATLLGHLPTPPQERAQMLAKLSLPAEIFGPSELVARLGPDHAGRYEILFSHLRAPLAENRPELSLLLAMDDPDAQARLIAPGTQLRAAIEAAFESLMRLDNLVALFGEEATRNPRQSFPRHFAERTFDALSRFPARANSFLAQLLLDVPGEAGFPAWLPKPAPSKWPEIAFSHATMLDALRALPQGETDFVHLSNILDWLSPEAASETLALTHRALRPGGLTVVRQLNSSLEIAPLGPAFDWQGERAAELHRSDRSFFYRALHVGRKPGP